MNEARREPPADGLGEIPAEVLEPLRSQSQADFEIGFFDAVLRGAPDYVDVLRCQGELFNRKGRHARALEIDRRLAVLLPQDAVVRYNLACSAVRNELRDEALVALRRAFELGYDDFEHLELDADLDALRNDLRFASLLAEFQPQPAASRRPKTSRRS